MKNRLEQFVESNTKPYTKTKYPLQRILWEVPVPEQGCRDFTVTTSLHRARTRRGAIKEARKELELLQRREAQEYRDWIRASTENRETKR